MHSASHYVCVWSCCRDITTDSFGHLCTGLPHLEHLALSAAAAPDLLGAIACLSGLRHLEGTDCDTMSDVSLSPSKHLTALRSLTLQELTEVNRSGVVQAHVLCQDSFRCFKANLLSNVNILFCTQVTAAGYNNIAQAPQLTSLFINDLACDSMCMHALAQRSTLVILQLEAGWASADAEGFERIGNGGLVSQRYHQCSPPRSLGLLKHLYVLRFINTMHEQAFVLNPQEVHLPALDPALAVAHMRLSRAVQTGCSIEEYYISMMRNKLEDYDRALARACAWSWSLQQPQAQLLMPQLQGNHRPRGIYGSPYIAASSHRQQSSHRQWQAYCMHSGYMCSSAGRQGPRHQWCICPPATSSLLPAGGGATATAAPAHGRYGPLRCPDNSRFCWLQVEVHA